MGKLIPLTRARSLGTSAEEELRVSATEVDVDLELLPVLGLLFLASLARVLRALWCHEPFDTEPTLALVFVLGLPWLALRWTTKRA